MCRFLIVTSEKKIDPQPFLNDFADVCQNSIAPNGDKQEDGWGVAWLDPDRKWQSFHSLSPIWGDKAKFSGIPQTSRFVVHARSATFPREKGVISYNQPYVAGDYCFVFNGALFGVHLDKPVPGNIGAQKIWSLLQEKLPIHLIADSVKQTKNMLEKSSNEIVALNLGLISKGSAAILCKYSKYDYYYTLYYHSGDQKIICSERLPGYTFTSLKNDEIIVV